MPANLMPNRQTTFDTALPDTEHDTHHHGGPNKFNDRVFYTAKVMAPGDKIDFEHDENLPSIISEHPVSRAHGYDTVRVTISAENHN
jgi:hypothetical protein